MLIFSFVNNFTSFYYLAYGARYVAPSGVSSDSQGMCGYNDCMIALAINLASLFGVRLVVGQFFSRVVPYLRFVYMHGLCTSGGVYLALRTCFFGCTAWVCCRRYYVEDDESAMALRRKLQYAAKREREGQGQGGEEEEEKDGEGAMSEHERHLWALGYSRAEWEHSMAPYAHSAPYPHLLFRYCDQLITFGHMTLFVSALPGALFLGVIFYVIEVNGDCWMLLNHFQRPFPSRVRGLSPCLGGAFDFLVTLAVATNAAMVGAFYVLSYL